MADEQNSTSHEDQDASTSTPKTRKRRRAGAPAGAPQISIETPAPAQTPTTSVPAQTSVVQQAPAGEELAPKKTTRRRRAAAPAGPPMFQTPGTSRDDVVVSPAPAEDAPAEEVVAEDTQVEEVSVEDFSAEEAQDEDAQEAIEGIELIAEDESSEDQTDSAEDSGEEDAEDSRGGIVDDLRALASSRPQPEDADRHARREQVQMDFASLFFQAPTPAPARDGSAADSPEEDADTEDEKSSSSRTRTRRRRAQRRESAPEATETESAETTEEASEAESDENEENANSTSRRRRRRGGRGRRGRGKSEEEKSAENSSDEQDAEEKDADQTSAKGASRRAKDQGEDTQAESEIDSDAESDTDDQGSSSSRRRRRRRRSGSSASENTSPDDPPNTVVKVREGRDEVKAVKGSTRLEAKKQRRREGRDAGRRRTTITEAEFLARRESVKRAMVVREMPGRVQIAVLEDNVLVEHYVAQKSHTSMVGNVYLGKVQNVLPSMEAAFVDIGKGRNAVLYAGEVNWDAAGLDGQPRRIELALKSGDPVLVQVTKDPIGHKGARLTSQVSLPGRYVVYVPGGSMTGISRKLPEAERTRLKKIMRQVIPEGAGVIVRTAAEGASEEELTRDVERLRAQWEKIEKAQKSKSAPAPLSQEPDLAIKVVRDVFNEDFTSLIVQGSSTHDAIHEYISEVAPDLLERLTRHVGEKDVFAKYRIDEQLLKAMDRKVYLPSGGSLVIDRTEAMTVIDVNTGKFTGSGGSLEETVTRNNLESAEEIVRQLRLRDIGGIIVIDFIDMVLESNRDLVLRRLVECLGRDRTKHQVAEVTSLGLVQMTRKRVGQGLVETFSHSCEACHGRGMIVDMDAHGQLTAEPKESVTQDGSANGSANGTSGGSTRSTRKRGGNSKKKSGTSGSAQEAVAELLDGSDEDRSSDIHRLAEDEASRALARATIASIAAASTPGAHPDVTVDGQVITVGDAGEDDAAQAESSPTAPEPAEAPADDE